MKTKIVFFYDLKRLKTFVEYKYNFHFQHDVLGLITSLPYKSENIIFIYDFDEFNEYKKSFADCLFIAFKFEESIGEDNHGLQTSSFDYVLNTFNGRHWPILDDCNEFLKIIKNNCIYD